jgi:hypothetical protein
MRREGWNTESDRQGSRLRPPRADRRFRRHLPASSALSIIRGSAEGEDEGAAHLLRIAKAGHFRDTLDRLGGLHALPPTSIRKRSTAFDGAAPVSERPPWAIP